MNRNILKYGVLLSLGLIAPFYVYPIFLMKVLCFALFACAYNLIGFAGLLAFGHAAFFGGAAYIAGYFLKVHGLPTELGILAGMALGAFLGLIFGYLAIRRSGIYFAMITLALAQLVYFFCEQAAFTGGDDGMQGIPRHPLFGFIDIGNDLILYYVVFAVFIIAFWLIYRTIYSPFGEILRGIRENENRTISLGYDVGRYKLLAFVLSATLSSLAGSMKAVVFQTASLTDVHWAMSGEAILMVIVGGMGTIIGPVIGALTIVGLQEYLADLGGLVPMIQGALFIIIVMFFRGGIVGEWNARWNSRRTIATAKRPAELKSTG